MKLWRSILLFSFALMLFVFTGCSSDGQAGEVVNLSFWDFHTEDEEEFFKGLVDEYNEMQDDVTIEYSTYNQNDYATTKLPVAFANDEGPDIFMTSPGDFQKYADSDILADLSSYFPEGVKDDFQASALDQVTVDGEILALPFELELLGLYYNKKMLDEANVDVPKTWDDLLTAAEKLTTDEVSGIALPTDKEPYFNFIWYPLLWQNGGSVLNEDGTESTFDSQEVAEALDMWGTMFKEGYAPSKLQYAPTEIDNIGNNKAAMQILGTWAIPRIEREFPDSDIELTQIPIPEGGEAATAAGGWKFAVNSRSDHVEEAAEFVIWAFGNEDIDRVKEFVTDTKFAYPARDSVVEEAEQFYDEGLRKVFTEEIYDSARPEPKFEPEIVDAVGEALQNVMASDMTGEEAAKEADKEIQNFLDSK